MPPIKPIPAYTTAQGGETVINQALIGGASAVHTEREIERELLLQFNSIEKLNLNLDMLWKRLEPVMRVPEPEAASGAADNAPATALGGMLRERSLRIQSANSFVEQMLKLLELS